MGRPVRERKQVEHLEYGTKNASYFLTSDRYSVFVEVPKAAAPKKRPSGGSKAKKSGGAKAKKDPNKRE
jgi:hypothetical protein